MATPAYKTQSTVSGSGNPTPVAWPVTVADGDLALLTVLMGSDNLDLSGVGLGNVTGLSNPAYANWTYLGRVAQFSSVSTGRGQALEVFAYQCDGTETGNVSVTTDLGATIDRNIVLSLWDNADGATSIDPTWQTNSAGNNTTFTVPAITPASDGLWVGIIGTMYNNTIGGYSVLTENYEYNPAGLGTTALASAAKLGGVSTGTDTGTISHTWVAASVVLYGAAPPTPGVGWSIGFER